MLAAIMLSSLGFGLNILALGQLLFDLTGSAQAFVSVLAFQGVGALCVLPFCGPIVDALSSQRVYLSAALGKAGCVVAVYGLHAAPLSDPVPYVTAAAVLLAVCDNIERAALFKFTAHHIAEAGRFNAVTGLVFQSGAVLGMACLGLVLIYGSAAEAMLVSGAASVLCSLIALGIRLEKSEGTQPVSAALLRSAVLGLLGDWRQMFRKHRHEVVVFATVVTCAADFFFANSLSTLVVPLVDEFYGKQSWYISALDATFGLGMISASFVTSHTARQGLLPLWLSVQTAVALVLSVSERPLIHFAGFLVAGFANLNSLVWLLTSLQQHAGDQDKAKMASLRLLAIGLGSVVLMPAVGRASENSLGTGFLTVATVMLAFTLCSLWVAARFRVRAPAPVQGVGTTDIEIREGQC